MPELIIQERGRAEPFVHSCAEEIISIGRHDSSTIQLKGRGVSRQHAKVLVDGDNCFIIDLKSGNGTFLNGMKLAPEEKNLLRPGDLITIDTYDIRFHAGSYEHNQLAIEETTDSDILEVKLLKKVLTALDKETVPSLEVLNGSAEGKRLYLTDELNEFVIGRDPDCEFPINEYVISRRHAQIIKRWGGIAIRDLESKNGTFLNNRRVVEEYLHDGDRIALGTIVCLFRNPQEINLAHLEDIRPKTRPAPVSPQEIPGLEEEPAPAQAEEAQREEAAETAEETPEQGEGEALEQWEQLEQVQQGYPTPQSHVEAIKRLTPIEIGMIGLGGLVLIFALITIVNLLFS
ncbi:MAG: FHA domain-containing protein [bacterium]